MTVVHREAMRRRFRRSRSSQHPRSANTSDIPRRLVVVPNEGISPPAPPWEPTGGGFGRPSFRVGASLPHVRNIKPEEAVAQRLRCWRWSALGFAARSGERGFGLLPELEKV